MRGRTAIGVIERPVLPADSFSGMAATWEPMAACYMEIQPLVGRELWSVSQLRPLTTTVIRTEFIDGITSDMRAVVDDAIYQFTGVIAVAGGRRELSIHCYLVA